MKCVYGLSTAVAGLLISAAGSAAVVPVSVIVDLKGPGAQLSSNGFSLVVTAASLATPVSIKDGDTLQLTIAFAGNEAISLSGAGSFSTRFQAVAFSQNKNTVSTGALTLLGVNLTSDVTSTPSLDSTNEFVDADSQFSNLPDPVSFTGLYWTGTVNYTDAPGTTRAFDTPSFNLFADSIGISGSAPSVPEPATWAMMVIGFGAVGAGLRGRRSTSVKFA